MSIEVALDYAKKQQDKAKAEQARFLDLSRRSSQGRESYEVLARACGRVADEWERIVGSF